MLTSGNTAASRAVHLGIIAVALLLRLAMFPHADETRDGDEIPYCEGSLAMLEGLPAGSKAAPAGPNFWVGWVYTGGVAAYDFLKPGPEERAVPIAVRPFVAVNRALFDQYRDLSRLHVLWIVTQLALVLWATSAAFRLGRSRGGLAGGILLGGFFAVLPLYVDFTDMSRPYMTSWAFGMLCLNASVNGKDQKRVLSAGIFLGLAIASRVEMLLLVPMVLWEFWNRPKAQNLFKVWMRLIAFTLVTAVLAAPWLVTHLIGNLRTITTVRLGPNPFGPTTFAGVLWRLAWDNGLVGAMAGFAIVLIALFMPLQSSGILPGSSRRGARLRLGVLVIYVMLLLQSLAHGTVYLHQQGPVVLALLAMTAFAAAVVTHRWPGKAPWIAAAILLVPLGQSIKMVHAYRRDYARDPSTEWAEQHVPPGTRIYTTKSLHNLLPTAEASAAIWDEVTNDQAWRRKFKSGLQRFGLAADQIPRALSEENMVQERGNRRGIFILGGRPTLNIPRFDIRYFDSSPIFGVHDVASAFAKTGGVVIIHGAPFPALGVPVAQWVSPGAAPVRSFTSHLKFPHIEGCSFSGDVIVASIDTAPVSM